MCDIYCEKCSVFGCENLIEMHLGDYATGRDEVAVYCEQHVNAVSHGTVWKYSQESRREEKDVKRWYKCRIVPVTKNAKANAHHNHPNAWHVKQEVA